MNQCDGCQRKLPTDGSGTHFDPAEESMDVWSRYRIICTKDRYEEKFTYATVQELRDQTIRRFLTYPNRCRLDGMRRDLDDGDKRVMAAFEATVEVLNRLGILDRAKLEAIVPKPFTADHEVLDEGIVGHNFTKQK